LPGVTITGQYFILFYISTSLLFFRHLALKPFDFLIWLLQIDSSLFEIAGTLLGA
jgi:hypothetical protein